MYLHLWDIAGIGSILAKWGRRAGTQQEVVYRTDYDPYEISRHYGSVGICGSATKWYMHAARTILSRRPDVIFVHGVWHHPWLWRRLAPRATLVFVGHGTEVRDGHVTKAMSRHFDKVCVATPDLLQYVSAVYMPNPVDNELFSGGHATNGRGIFRVKGSQTRRDVMTELDRRGFGDVQWDVIPHTKYADMPGILAQYEYAADLSMFDGAGTVEPLYSTFGLQSMAMGLRVVCHDGVRDALPAEHDPDVCWRRYAKLCE